MQINKKIIKPQDGEICSVVFLCKNGRRSDDIWGKVKEGGGKNFGFRKYKKKKLQMARTAPALLMLKLDGLTIKLCYENGQLVEASTRGDGDVGEVITHNIPAFHNVPLVKISALLGHSSVNTMFEYYCDQMDETEKIIGFMNNTFSLDGGEKVG